MVQLRDAESADHETIKQREDAARIAYGNLSPDLQEKIDLLVLSMANDPAFLGH